MYEEVSQVLGAESAGWPVVASGKTYLLTPPTFKDKSRFESWLKTEAKKAALEDRAILPRDEFAALLACINTQIGSGLYRWGGPIYFESLNKGTGFQELARILLQKHHPGITADEVREALEDNTPDFGFTLNMLLDAAPNSPPPPNFSQILEENRVKTGARKE